MEKWTPWIDTAEKREEEVVLLEGRYRSIRSIPPVGKTSALHHLGCSVVQSHVVLVCLCVCARSEAVPGGQGLLSIFKKQHTRCLLQSHEV